MDVFSLGVLVKRVLIKKICVTIVLLKNFFAHMEAVIKEPYQTDSKIHCFI